MSYISELNKLYLPKDEGVIGGIIASPVNAVRGLASGVSKGYTGRGSHVRGAVGGATTWIGKRIGRLGKAVADYASQGKGWDKQVKL